LQGFGYAGVACGFVAPAAGLGIGAEGVDVIELDGEHLRCVGCGDEVVALLADVGVWAGTGGLGAGAVAVGEAGLEHFGVQPLDPVRYNRCAADGNDRQRLSAAKGVRGGLVGGADGR